MILETSLGERFELRIQGYQYPSIQNDKYDSNWLNVKVEVTHSEGHWVVCDPCLLTYEVEKLADWLIKIAAGDIKMLEPNLMESNLTFRLVNTSDELVLRVYFEMEARPNWRPSNGKLMEDLWVEFPLNELNLHKAATDLLIQLSKYPKRAIV